MKYNYEIIIQDNIEYRVFKTSDEAYQALTLSMYKKGWRIGNYNGYENCIWH